jgi:predicted P-loop ATPase
MRIQPNVNPPFNWTLNTTSTYRSANGREVLFYVGHYTGGYDAGGNMRRTRRAFTFAETDGWRCEPWNKPRPLYNLNGIAAAKSLPVMLCADEQSADAAAHGLGAKWVMSTWPGGYKEASNADYSVLQGRDVYIWPDADPEGTLARNAVIDALSGVAAGVWVLDVVDCVHGWNAHRAADEDGWAAENFAEWITRGVKVDDKPAVPRVRKHKYDEGTVAAGLIKAAMESPEPPQRKAPRGHSNITLSARHWENADWIDHMVLIEGKGGKKNVAPKCVENALAPLLYDDNWKDLFAWDELRQRITTTRATCWGEQPEEWVDHHYTSLECWYDRSRMFYGRGLIRQAVELAAHKNSFHPVRDYLNGLKWDGTERLALWLTTYCGTPNNPFNSFVGKAWMISAVARAMQPGCQVKTCLILFGAQDAGKSEVFRILGGKFYAVQNGAIGGDSNKAVEQCSKVWVVEMAELAKLKRSDDIESIKSFMSTYEDVYRPAYAGSVQTIPRCCIFCGTSNSKEVFSDVTGNVRFWPVPTYKQIDLESLRNDRDQLWAEAVERYRAGDKWWIDDTNLRALANEATQDYAVRDEWSNVIEEFIASPENRLRKSQAFTTSEILSGALKIDVGKYTKSEQNRVSNCMRQLGYENVTVAYLKEEHERMPEGTPKSRRAWRKIES